jgi:hypothetical protein
LTAATAVAALALGDDLRTAARSDVLPAVGQDTSDAVRVDDIEVFGRRGAALVAASSEFDGAEIDAFGAWDIGEVLRRIGETSDVADDPLVIVNGKRLANPNVFYGFPPDALVRVEVLPADAAGLYGGAPGQTVVNLVLQRRFASYDARVSGSRPTQGGTSSLAGDLRRSTIVGEATRQAGIRLSSDTSLRASERSLTPLEDGLDWGRLTLRPQVETFSASLNLTQPLGDWASVVSLSGQARESASVRRKEDQQVGERETSSGLTVSSGLSGNALGWAIRANFTGQASQSRASGYLETQSHNGSLALNASVNRILMRMPDGPIVLNLGGNLAMSRLSSQRDDLLAVNAFTGREARWSLTAPLVRGTPRTTTGRLIGDLQITLGGALRESSRGAGDEWNGGLAWTPRRWLRMNGVWSRSTETVPDEQRSQPIYVEDPRVVFDFRTGAAVQIIPIFGGNPDLRAPHIDRLSIKAAVGPLTSWDVSGSVAAQHSASLDGIGALPALTEDVEALFPDRFTRDADGRLVSVDYRPLNFSSVVLDSVTSNISFTLPRRQAAVGGASIWRVAISHNLRLRSTLNLATGLPELNRLEGDGGGVSRQDAAVAVDAREGRWSANGSVRWQDGYRTRRTAGIDDSRDLIGAPFSAVDLKIGFQMAGPSISRSPATADSAPHRSSGGLLLSMEVENLFDARPEVRLGDGSPAPGYGRDAQDPIGRKVRVTLQRRF